MYSQLNAPAGEAVLDGKIQMTMLSIVSGADLSGYSQDFGCRTVLAGAREKWPQLVPSDDRVLPARYKRKCDDARVRVATFPEPNVPWAFQSGHMDDPGRRLWMTRVCLCSAQNRATLGA